MDNLEKVEVFTIRDTKRLKGIAIQIIILGHCGIVFTARIGVVIFLVLSGYGLYKSFLKNGLQYYWQKKILKVYIPYLIVTIVKLVFNPPMDYRIYVFSIFGQDFGLNIDNSMWYISYIFLWYFLFYLFALLSRNTSKRIIVVLMLLAGGIAYYISLKYDIAYHPYRGVDSYGFCFPIGVILAYLDEKGIFFKYKKAFGYLSGFIVLLSMGLIHNYSNNLNTESPLYSQEYMFFSFSIAYMVICMTYLLRNKQNIVLLALEKIGDLSFEMYLIEAWLLEITFRKTINENNVYIISALAVFSITICAFVLKKVLFDKMTSSI